MPPFQELVDAHWRDVARLAVALAGPQDGQDVAQQVWLQAMRGYPKLADGANLRGWLFTITSRAAVDAHRARARQPLVTQDLPEAAAALADPPDAALWDRVRALPERQRTAVALHYVLDLPHREVGLAMGTTSAASRRLVSDALRTLRSTCIEARTHRSEVTR